MPRHKQRFAAFCIGCVTVVVLTEIFLRVLGAAYSYGIYNDKRADSDKYVILCVGDSYVYGSGAAPGKSFPAQLEGLLNSNNTGNKADFVVINRGVPAQNTSELINQLQDNIDALRPDLILLLSGGANYWNYFGYVEPQERGDILHALRNYSRRIRIYKLTKLLWINFRSKFTLLTSASLALANKGSEGIESEYSRLGENCYAQGEYGRAIGYFLKIVELDRKSVV